MTSQKKRSVEQIQEEVRLGNIGAITLDTSAFEQQGLKLERGLLKQLQQFRNKPPFQFILSDIVRSEVISHIERKTREAQDSVKKSLRKAEQYHLLSRQNLASVESLICDDKSPKEIALSRFLDFSEATSLKIIHTEDLVKISSLTNAYFENSPPFAETGAKKNEFPDAMALFALKKWSEKNRSKVLVVSSDHDWKQFCNSSQYLVLVEELSDAIASLQPLRSLSICQYLSQKYSEGRSQLRDEIDDRLQENLYNCWAGFEFSFEEETSFFYDIEDVDVIPSDFRILARGLSSMLFKPIDLSDKFLVAEARVEIDVEITFYFSFFLNDCSEDNERIYIGASDRTSTTTLKIDVLLYFENMFDQVVLEEVEDVAIELASSEVLNISQEYRLDFGFLTPD